MEQTEVARGLLEASPPKLSVSWSQLLPHEARSTDHTHIRTCHHPPQSGPGQHCPGEQPDPTHWQAEPPVEGEAGAGQGPACWRPCGPGRGPSEPRLTSEPATDPTARTGVARAGLGAAWQCHAALPATCKGPTGRRRTGQARRPPETAPGGDGTGAEKDGGLAHTSLRPVKGTGRGASAGGASVGGPPTCPLTSLTFLRPPLCSSADLFSPSTDEAGRRCAWG